jgi:hypothetical protein
VTFPIDDESSNLTHYPVALPGTDVNDYVEENDSEDWSDCTDYADWHAWTHEGSAGNPDLSVSGPPGASPWRGGRAGGSMR